MLDDTMAEVHPMEQRHDMLETSEDEIN